MSSLPEGAVRLRGTASPSPASCSCSRPESPGRTCHWNWDVPTRRAGRCRIDQGSAGRTKSRPNPTDRGRCASKSHPMPTHHAVPLGNMLAAANLHNLRPLLPLVFLKFSKAGGKRGRPLDRFRSVTADKGHDCQTTRALLSLAGVDAFIPGRGDLQDSSLSLPSIEAASFSRLRMMIPGLRMMIPR